MKNSKIFLALMLGLVISTGCSKWDQDPMKDKEQKLIDGQDKPTVPEATKPIQSDAVRIDTVEFYSFTAGAADEFKIKGRVLLADYSYETEILNLADFPGAQYDAATGVFSWTPSAEIISGMDLYQDLTLQIQVVAKKLNSAILMATKNVPIRVNRELKAPEVVSATTISTGGVFREGDIVQIAVTINDPTATLDAATWPSLMFKEISGVPSLAVYASTFNVSRLANGQFQANVVIDLSNAEVTKSKTTLGLAVKAVSAFNKVGTEKPLQLDVLNKLSNVVTTWTQQIDAALNSKVDYQFMILDPKSEGVLQKPIFSNLPKGAQVDCSFVTDSSQSCRLLWSVPANQALGRVMFSAATVLGNKYSSDTVTVRQNFNYTINVVKMAGPAPAGDLK